VQVNALPPRSNAPTVIDFVLSFVPADAYDAILPSPADPSLTPGSATLLTLAEDLLNSALEDKADGGSTVPKVTRTQIGGQRANWVVEKLVIQEAMAVAQRGELLRPVAAAVRWAFENLPRNVPVALVRLWGDRGADPAAHLETAYACARLGRAGSGLRQAAKVMNYQQARCCLVLDGCCPSA
jgi:hypothetical protein